MPIPTAPIFRMALMVFTDYRVESNRKRNVTYQEQNVALKIKKAPHRSELLRGAKSRKGVSTMHHGILNSKVLDTCLAYVCLLDLVRKPCWAVCRLVDDVDASCEDVDSLGSTLT